MERLKKFTTMAAFNIGSGRTGQSVTGDAASAADPGAREASRSSMWLGRITRGGIYTILFLVPIFFSPFTQDPLFAKAVLVKIAAVVVGGAWVLNVLFSKRVSYKRSPLNAAFLLVAIAFLASTFASQAPWASFWGPDPTGEKTASVLAFIVIAFVVSATLVGREIEQAIAALLASFSLLGLFTLVSILLVRFGVALPSWFAVNPAGTVNGLGYVLGAGLAFSGVLAMTRMTSAGRMLVAPRLGWLAVAAAVLTFVPFLLIGFRTGWIVLGAVMLVAIALNFVRTWPREGGGEHALGPASLVAAFLILFLSIFLLFRPLPLVGRVFQPPVEVSPSLRSTLTIGKSALAERPLLGFGPASFRTAFNRFRDPALNATAFWQVRFGHGFSAVTTMLATVGIAGFLSVLALVAAAVAVLGRGLIKTAEPSPLLWASAGGAFFVLLMWFAYAGNFTASFLLFAFLGLAGALLSERRAESDPAGTSRSAPMGRPSWWRVSRRSLLVDAPALHFAASLVAVFTAALSLVALWGLLAGYAAETYFLRAARAFSQFGNADTARVFLNRAVELNGGNDTYHQGLAEVAVASVQRTVSQAAANPSQDLSVQFREEFSGGVASGQRAVSLSPSEPLHWSVLGQLYETVIPFIPGADRAAIDAYDRASAADPLNPIWKFSRGRALVAAGDLASLQASQSRGEERSRWDGAYKESLEAAREALEASVGLKADFAPAHFLLAQVYLRQGNTRDAIRRTLDAASIAPNDVGIAFQLGVLYYRSGDLNRAADAFRRAIALSDTYSNARYFLGLIYGQKGDRDGAISQFEKIAALNPGNDEVRKILANLRSGRPALEEIAPPAEAPEERREVPVPEGEEATPLRRR